MRHSVVVLDVRLGEDLLELVGAGVAARLGERQNRRLVDHHFDRVVRRSGDPAAVRAGKLDAVERVALDRDRGGETAALVHGESDRLRLAALLALDQRAGRSVTGTVEVTSTRTSVPRRAAMSPPSSTRCGDMPV